MRGLRFGIVAIGLAVLFLGGYGRFLLWRLERRMPPGITHPLPLAADAGLVKADLCRIARAQRAFFASVGRFASTHELSSMEISASIRRAAGPTPTTSTILLQSASSLSRQRPAPHLRDTHL